VNLKNNFTLLLLLVPSVALGQVADGLPDPTGKKTPINICHQADSGPTCEVFLAPEVTKDTSIVLPVEVSPRDPKRTFDAIPNFGLAKFHWWVFSQGIHRAQREYTECISRISELQMAKGEIPIDSPNSSEISAISNVREYEIPFEAIQNINTTSLPPTLRDAIEHVKAAAATINAIVAANVTCKDLLNKKREEFYREQTQLKNKLNCYSTRPRKKRC